MTNQSSSEDRDRAALMDAVFLSRLLDQLTEKIDDIGKSTNEIKGEVIAIKTRLFHGLTETLREAYAKTLAIETRQDNTETKMYDVQRQWIEQFTLHDTREKLFLYLFGMIMVVMMVTFSAIVAINLQKHGLVDFLDYKPTLTESTSPVNDNSLSLVGP